MGRAIRGDRGKGVDQILFSPIRIELLTVLTVLLGTLTGARHAQACSLSEPIEHVLVASEAALDATPPTPAQLLRIQLKRGVGPQALPDGTYLGSSCDDLATVSLVLVPASDDRTPPDKIGYALEVVAGDAPRGLRLPRVAWRLRENILHLAWIDGAQDEQEPIDFTVRIIPIDLAANRGSPLSVRIQDGGRRAAGPTLSARSPGLRVSPAAGARGERRAWPGALSHVRGAPARRPA